MGRRQLVAGLHPSGYSVLLCPMFSTCVKFCPSVVDSIAGKLNVLHLEVKHTNQCPRSDGLRSSECVCNFLSVVYFLKYLLIECILKQFRLNNSLKGKRIVFYLVTLVPFRYTPRSLPIIIHCCPIISILGYFLTRLIEIMTNLYMTLPPSGY